jgi:transposase
MIANMLEGMEPEEAARLVGLSRSGAYERHNRYEEDGIEGLRDRRRPGRPPRVGAVTTARFKERIVAGAELQRDGVVAFRGVGAKRILKEEFDIDCSLSSIYRRHRVISDSEIRPWLDHLKYLVPDPEEGAVVLDWMAHLVQRRLPKANFAILVGGIEGIGKSLLFDPIVRFLRRVAR